MLRTTARLGASFTIRYDLSVEPLYTPKTMLTEFKDTEQESVKCQRSYSLTYVKLLDSETDAYVDECSAVVRAVCKLNALD